MKARKIVNFILVAVLSLGVALTAASCKNKDNEIRIWSTYNTLKVNRVGDDYVDLGQSLSVFMGKNETEGAQLLVSPKKKIKAVKLVAADLKTHDGTVFLKEKVTVYFQKYINVEIKTNTQNNIKYPIGYIPDMLLPMELAEKHGENSVAGGDNQGFTVEFTTDSNSVPGTYTGNFTLDADGKEFVIPVTLEILDVDLLGANGMTSVRALSTNYMNGEYNNSPEMYRAYYETAMNEYKFMLDRLPGSNDPDEMAESAVFYWDNPNFTSYSLPVQGYSSANAAVEKTLVKGEFYSYMYALAKKSKPNQILFDKAYIYPMYLDEVRRSAYEAVRSNMQDIYEIEQLVYDDLRAEGFFDDYDESFAAAFYEAITNIPIVITVDGDQIQVLGNDVNTYCARIELLNLPTMREQYEAARQATESHGGQTWFYTCMLPVYPQPSHHIDDGLLGARVMRWMQKDYGWNGYLHWSFNSYHIYTGSDVLNCDPYEEASRFPGTVGDGFMFYPGKKYGVDTFLPSIRLTTFRDGQEDYDMLCALDKIIAEKEAFYSLPNGTVSANTYVDDLYKSLYAGTVYNDDDALLYAARRQLAETVTTHRSETKFLVSTSISAGKAISEIYLSRDYEMTVNGNRLRPSGISGNGLKYTVTQMLDKEAVLDVVVTKGGDIVEKHNIFVAAETHSVALDEGVLYVSDTGEVNYADNTASIVLKSKGGSLNEILTFVPLVGFSGFGNTLDTVGDISFTLTNTMTVPLELRARLKAGYYTYDLSRYTVEAGATQTIVIKDVYSYLSVFSSLKDATIELYAENIDENSQLLPDKSFTLFDLNYSVKREAA